MLKLVRDKKKVWNLYVVYLGTELPLATQLHLGEFLGFHRDSDFLSCIYFGALKLHIEKLASMKNAKTLSFL